MLVWQEGKCAKDDPRATGFQSNGTIKELWVNYATRGNILETRYGERKGGKYRK